MSEYIERDAEMNVCERSPITQAIKGGEKSICWSCFHWAVCFVKENQPCIKCTRYIPAADVRPVVRGKWVTPTVIDGRAFNIPHCSACDGVPCGVDEHTNFCPNCGASMVNENE